MKRKKVWLLLSCLLMLSLVLASCAPAPPATPTAPTAPATPTTPTAPMAPTVPTTPTAPARTGAEMVKVRLTKKNGTVVEKLMEKPRYGGVYATIPSGTSVNWDPAVRPNQEVLTQTHDELVRMNWAWSPTGTNEYSGIFSHQMITFKTGQLAESWEIPDGNTIIYRIRKGVHFALDPKSEASRLVNGREITAEDVVYSINRRYEDLPGSYVRSQYLPEEWPVSVKALDKWTVEVKSNPGLLDIVVAVTADWAYIHPREVVQKYGNMNDWKNSVGTGPFTVADYIPASSVTFVRNPNYWAKDPFFPENQLPYLDGVKYLFITDLSTIMAALRTAKIDGLWSKTMINKADLDSLLKTNPQIKFKKALDFYSKTLHLVVDNPELPWYDLRVRRALQMAIDRKAIARDYYQGDAEILAAPALPPSSYPDYAGHYTPLEEQSESVKEMYTYNPTKAKQLLAEAGYPKGFKMKVDTSTEYDVDLLTLVKFYFEKVGVDLEIKVHEAAVFTSISLGKAIKEAGWNTHSSNTPYAFHYFSCQDNYNYAAGNFDPHTREVRKQVFGAFTLNELEIWHVMKDFNKYALEQAWMIFMPAPYLYIPWQPWVKGYSGESNTGRGDYLGFPKYIWIDQNLKQQMTGKR